MRVTGYLRRNAVSLAGLVGLLLAPVGARGVPAIAGIAVPTPQAQAVLELNEKGKALLGEGKHQEAIAQFDRAIEEDETYWEPWYQRGRALALLSRYEEATESLLEASRLNPGHANTYMLASLAAMYAVDYDLAWEQGIRAYLAGEDEQSVFGGLRGRSEQPADFDERVQAWRVFVGGIDTRELQASAQQPRNTRGGATGVLEELGQIQAELTRLQRHLANAISDSRAFGLVTDAGLAQYIVTISPGEIAATPRPTMAGYLYLYEVESGDQVYSRPVEFRDLGVVGQVSATLQRLMNNMESWRADEMKRQ